MRFNLITEPCIPVVDFNAQQKLLSLRDALLTAHELADISHGSPVVTISLVRFLVAGITDMYQIQGEKQWQNLWKNGYFDAERLDHYFEEYADRFDLFHPKYPFYQVAALEDDNPINLNLLKVELATGNNPTLFDHSLDSEESDYTPIEAFHLLLATQNFSLAGLLRRATRLQGESEPVYWQSAFAAPLIPGAVVWLSGNSLFETILLNITPLDSPSGDDEPEWWRDIPAWRRDKPIRDRMMGKTHHKENVARGILDQLTWQSRLVRLLPLQTQKGLVVRRACFNFGRSPDNPNNQNWFDPMLAYKKDEKKGLLVTRLSPEKASWRNIHTFIGVQLGSIVSPTVVQNVSKETRKLDSTYRLRLNVGGLANDQAKVLLWRHDRYTIPTAVLENPDLVQQIEFLLGEAEELGGMLWGATRRLCEHFLAPMAFDPQGKPYEGTMKADPDKVTALASCIDPRPSYWARLESFFQTLLLHLPTEQERTPEDWKDAIETTARQSFEEAVTQLGDSIQALKAMSLTRPNFQAASRRPRTENGSKQKRNKKEVAK